MISFKCFNRFLVAGLLLAGQTSGIQAYNYDVVKIRIEEITNGQAWGNSKFDISTCEIKDNEQGDLIAQLTDAHSGLSTSAREQINTLNLGGNNFTSLPKNLLALFPNVQVLNLSNNALNGNVDSLLDIPTTIVTLNLAWNDFTFLPEEIFNPLVNLQNIDLSYNLQLKISLPTLWSLSKCKTINIMLTQQHTYLCGIPERQNDQDLKIIEWLANFNNLETTFINNSLPPLLKAIIKCHKYGITVGEEEYKPKLENLLETISQKQEELDQLIKENKARESQINQQNKQIATLMNEINELGFQ